MAIVTKTCRCCEGAGFVIGPEEYNSEFGDETICKCGHPYYRHFDSYDEMFPVGCKYCDCATFEDPEHA